MLNWQCESIIVDNDNVQVEILNYFEYCLLYRITLGIICKKKKKKSWLKWKIEVGTNWKKQNKTPYTKEMQDNLSCPKHISFTIIRLVNDEASTYPFWVSLIRKLCYTHKKIAEIFSPSNEAIKYIYSLALHRRLLCSQRKPTGRLNILTYHYISANYI